MKHIKKFNKLRNYEYIKHRLLYVYDIPTSDEDLEHFELDNSFDDNWDDTKYITNYVNFYFGLEHSHKNPNMSIDEDVAGGGGVAAVSAATVAGMGPVVSAQPSSIPGQTISSSANSFSTPGVGSTYGNGGTVGSGDIGSGWSPNSNSNVRTRDSHLPKNRRKKKMQAAAKAMKANISNFKVKSNNEIEFSHKKDSNVKSFSEFVKGK